MAVLVERQRCLCPNCNELLSYTSADVRMHKKDSTVIYHENGKSIPRIETKVLWILICPTCKNSFKVASFSRYKNL